MSILPSSLQKYLVFVYGCAAAILFFCLQVKPTIPENIFVLGFFILLGIATDFIPVLYKGNIHRGTISQTLGTATFTAAAFILPPFSLLIVIATSSVLSDVLERKEWYKILFNVSNRFLCFGVMSIIVAITGIGEFQLSGITEISIYLSMFILYAILQIVPMGTVIALADHQNLFIGWRTSIRCFNEYDMALFPYGIILAWLWHSNSWFFLVGLIPLIATHRSFSIQAKLLSEQSSTERLAKQQQRVQAATTMLLSSQDVHAQLDTLLEHLMEVFPVARASVLIWGEGNEDPQIVSRGNTGPELPILSWTENLRRVSEGRRLIRLDRDYVTRVTGGRPVVLVPLVTADDTVGCLVLVAYDAAALDLAGENLIETFAAQAALAIYQARLINRLKSSQVRVVQSERLAAIGTLAAGVAHEFNNLLAGISGVAQLALMDDDQEERRSALDTVVHAAQQGGSISRGLLTFARHLEPKRERVDIRTAIEPVLSMMQGEFRRANVSVLQYIEPVSPMLCDIGMISQVVLNLITNALDAMHPHGGTLTVSLREQHGYIRLAVSDTGCGIPEEVRDRIFEPFVSTKTPSDGKLHGGTGLGLAISYGIITDHGGTFDVQSEANVGTTMTIWLPTTATDLEYVQAATTKQRHTLQMIVVDDDPLIAKSLHGMLVREGHDAQWFTEPLQALQAIDSAECDVIFTDLMMPQMDGVALLQHVRERAPSATQVVVTGQIDPPQIERAQALGVHAVIEKPFSLEAIRAVVQEARLAHGRP